MPRIILSPHGFYHADNAVIAGDVQIGTDSSIWFGTVVRADVAPIRIGSRVNIQDNSVVHCDSNHAQVIEDDVSIAHGAIVHGIRIGAGTLIGMGARVLGQASVGRHCIIAAGAVVPEGMEVPDRTLVMGVPARKRRDVTSEELEYISWISRHYVKLSQRWISGEFKSLT